MTGEKNACTFGSRNFALWTAQGVYKTLFLLKTSPQWQKDSIWNYPHSGRPVFHVQLAKWRRGWRSSILGNSASHRTELISGNYGARHGTFIQHLVYTALPLASFRSSPDITIINSASLVLAALSENINISQQRSFLFRGKLALSGVHKTGKESKLNVDQFIGFEYCKDKEENIGV